MKLEELLISPRLGIENALEELTRGLDGDVIPKDYNTTFHNLLEVSRNLAVDSMLSSGNIIRKKFPYLASNMEELFFSVHDEVKDNLFSIGGIVPIVFYINVIDLKQYGIRENSGYTTNIPAGSTITALSTVFTLLNDISITLKDNNIVTVEQKESELDIAINDIRLLTANIITDDNGLEWIIFETTVRNITKKTITVPITHVNEIKTEINLLNKYSTIDIGYTTNSNNYRKMKVSYSDEYIDETTATALVVLKDNSIVITIPKIYILNNMVGDNIVIDLYETEGEKVLDLSRLGSEDFTLNIENESKDKYSATAPNIIMANVSRGTLSNGVNAMNFEELKEAIISSTLGDIDLPITTNQITRKAKMSGYELRVTTDTLSKRMFIASKPMPTMENKLLYSTPDIFFNKAEILISEDNNSEFIEQYETSFIVKENIVYFKDVDGLLKILPDTELAYFNSLDKTAKSKYLKIKKLLYSPLTYVIRYEKDITTTEVYYLKPSIDTIRILNTNSNVNEKVNTSKFDITKTKFGYTIRVMPVLNSEASSSNLNTLRGRLHVPIKDSNSTVYFDSEYVVDENLFYFDIYTGELENGVYKIVNGKSILKDIMTSLSTSVFLYLYTEDQNIIDNSKFLLNEIGEVDKNITIFSKEQLNITFGKKIEYVYNSILTLFTNNHYKRHSSSVPMVYEEDVYLKYGSGLLINPITLSNGQVDLQMQLLHSKGEAVLDQDGNPIYKYKVNDIMLDDKGNPIIDKYSGIKRVMDVLMLEYEYFIADSEPYQNYRTIMMNTIMSMINEDMISLNKVTMDVTKIKYKTFRNTKKVMILVNNIVYPMEHYITPKITLILDKNNLIYNTELLEEIKSICGKIITKHLNFDKIVIEDIRKEIMNSISINVISVKVAGIEPKNSEVIITTDDNRFTINKTLSITESNQTVVKYDLELELEYI